MTGVTVWHDHHQQSVLSFYFIQVMYAYRSREQIYLGTVDVLVTKHCAVLTVSVGLVGLFLSLCTTAHAPLVGTQHFCIPLLPLSSEPQ